MAHPNRRTTRREFFRGLARAGSLVGLAGLGAALVAGDRGAAPADETCIHRGLCRHCRVFDTCRLPQALVTRRMPHKG